MTEYLAVVPPLVAAGSLFAAVAEQGGLGRLRMIEGAGHYPHDQYPDQVASLVLACLGSAARA